MKLFLFEFAHDRKYGAFASEEEAYEQRATVDSMYEWTPVEITEVTVEGYELTLTPVHTEDKPVLDMSRDELKKHLKANNIQFTAQWGEDKLRELALQHA